MLAHPDADCFHGRRSHVCLAIGEIMIKTGLAQASSSRQAAQGSALVTGAPKFGEDTLDNFITGQGRCGHKFIF